MYSEAVLQEIAGASTDVRTKLAKKVAAILALVESYRHLGKGFTFDCDSTLDRQVNKLLAELSDEVLEDTEERMRKAIREAEDEEDSDEIIAWVKSDKNAQDTLDKYASHLKFILEGWVTIGFANQLSSGNILSNLLAFIANPYISPLWIKAFKEGKEYAAKIIQDGGYHWKKGMPVSPLRGLVMVESDMINTAYNHGVIYHYRHSGAIGYRVFRGSSYDCPRCDEQCVGIHPID